MRSSFNRIKWFIVILTKYTIVINVINTNRTNRTLFQFSNGFTFLKKRGKYHVTLEQQKGTDQRVTLKSKIQREKRGEKRKKDKSLTIIAINIIIIQETIHYFGCI